jgi:hypothetical protein
VTRFLRILRAAISVLSLLFCFAITFVWVRGYFVADSFQQYSTIDIQNRSYRPIIQVDTGKGGIAFTRTFWSGPIGSLATQSGIPSQPLIHWKQSPLYPDFRFRPSPPPFLGFKFKRIAASLPNGSTVRVFAFVLPLWSVWLVFLLVSIPELLYRYRLFRRHRNPGLCPNCGYDLRASPEKCPECGHCATLRVTISA